MTRARLTALLVVLGSIALGFALTAGGMATWDSLANFDRSRWLLHVYGLPSSRTASGLDETMKWYGPLWALFLALMSEVELKFVRDPTWVQHAFNFALFPVGLYATERLLERAGVRRSTAILAAALLFGAIRLGGHALLNVNDFPMAMLSLLAMLYLWTKLREVDVGARAAGRMPRPTLVLLGMVAIVPFLIRPPVALQLVTLMAFLALYGWTALRGARWWRRGELLAIPLAAAVVFTVAVWPALWEHGRTVPWRKGLTIFARFGWRDTIRYFGRSTMSNALPRWYPFIWLPVMLSPATFLVLLWGLGRGALRRSLAPQSFLLPTRPRGTHGDTLAPSLDLSLRRWLAIHVALLWLAVIVLHPTIYDEERHLLFLYPPLLVLAALGLDDLGERLKYGLVVLVVATACRLVRPLGALFLRLQEPAHRRSPRRPIHGRLLGGLRSAGDRRARRSGSRRRAGRRSRPARSCPHPVRAAARGAARAGRVRSLPDRARARRLACVHDPEQPQRPGRTGPARDRGGARAGAVAHDDAAGGSGLPPHRVRRAWRDGLRHGKRTGWNSRT